MYFWPLKSRIEIDIASRAREVRDKMRSSLNKVQEGMGFYFENTIYSKEKFCNLMLRFLTAK